MEGSAYIVELVAAVVYLVAGTRLMLLSRRTGEAPERSLALSLFLLGVSYLFYQIPLMLESDVLLAPLSFCGRIALGISCLMMAVFTRSVFRCSEIWAVSMVWALAVLMLVGVVGGVLIGDWEGASIRSMWFWYEWLAQLTPFVWAGTEGFIAYRSARQRVKLDLCDAVVCNRFLLWGVFGVLQLATYLTLIPMYAEYAEEGRYSALMDAVLGVLEMLSVCVVWLVFFAPKAYRDWVSGARQGAASC